MQLDEFLNGVAWVPDDDDEDADGDAASSAAFAASAAAASSSTPEQAVAQCLFHLHHLANLWQPVLSPDVYRACLGRLLRHATAPLAAALVASPAVPESATHRLHAVLSDLLRAHAALFGSTGSNGTGGLAGDVTGSSNGGSSNNGNGSGSLSTSGLEAALEGDGDESRDCEAWRGAWWRRLMALRGLLVSARLVVFRVPPRLCAS